MNVYFYQELRDWIVLTSQSELREGEYKAEEVTYGTNTII